MKTKLKFADLYFRLSNDERNGGESESIQNQRNIVRKFCDDNDITIIREFVDDGYSGANFERPGFKAMLEHLKTGLANMVITKDLSRLGRDMTESSYYSEKYFPENGIQFITVSDNYDSNSPTPFSSLQFAINDYYLRETSHKINQVLKHKRGSGEYCACPPFGYLKSREQKGVLTPDPITAPIVQYIFRLASEGKSSHRIAEILTEEGYITPLKYRVIYRDTFTEAGAARATDEWNHTTVKRILKNKVYLGHTILGKSKKVSLKSKKKVALPEEEWVVTENTHQSLVDNDTFEKAQYFMGIHTKAWDKHPHFRKSIFNGIVYCANCGAAMCSCGTVYKGEREKYWYLACNNIARKDSKRCEHGARIKYSHLTELIKSELNELIKLSDEDIDKIINSVINKTSNSTSYDNTKERIDSISKRLVEIDRTIDKLYRDNISGIIDDNRLEKMIRTLTEESDKLKAQLEGLENKSEADKSIEDNYRKFFDLVKKYAEIDELTEDIVRMFIEKIEIGEKILPDGYKIASHKETPYSQKIKIKYRFIDSISQGVSNIDVEKEAI